MMTRVRQGVFAVVATAALAGLTSPAWASTALTTFGGNLPRAQQSMYLSYKKKATTAADATVYVDSIGGNSYQVNLKVQNENGTEYTELKGNDARSGAYKVQDKTGSGNNSRLVLTNSTWTTVDVSVSGRWANN